MADTLFKTHKSPFPEAGRFMPFSILTAQFRQLPWVSSRGRSRFVTLNVNFALVMLTGLSQIIGRLDP